MSNSKVSGDAGNQHSHKLPLLPSLPLPSLLRYVDYDLVRLSALHNHPPNPNAVCGACNQVHYTASVKSTFLPLWPCGCWVHYRCFVQHATRDTINNECCPVCNTKLFQTEGIVALTLAARTAIEMQNIYYAAPACYIDPLTGNYIDSHASLYISDCEFIETVIKDFVQAQFQTPPAYHDGSPDLNTCFRSILSSLENYSRPQAPWLHYSKTDPVALGSSLFDMLVLIKMQKHLQGGFPEIVFSTGWAALEAERKELQGLIRKKIIGVGVNAQNNAAGAQLSGRRSTVKQSIVHKRNNESYRTGRKHKGGAKHRQPRRDVKRRKQVREVGRLCGTHMWEKLERLAFGGASCLPEK